MSRRKNLKETIPGLWQIIRRFWPQIRKQGFLIVGSFLALLAETILHLLEPWPLKLMFDNIILTGFHVKSLGIPVLDSLTPTTLLTVLALALVAIASFRGAAAYFSTVGMALAATHVMTEIRSKLYSHLQRLSLAFHHKAKSGDLIARVTYDIERLREVTVVAALPLLTNILTLVGMLSVMFWINLELALIAIAIFPLFLFSTLRMTKQIRGVARKQRKREGAMAATAAKAMGAIKVVQALSLQDLLESTFSKQNKKSLKEGAQAQKLTAGLERTVEVLVAIAQVTLRPTETFGFALTYIRSFNSLDTGTGSKLSNDPFDGDSKKVMANSYGLEVSWQLSPTVILGSWVGFTQASAQDLSNQPEAQILNYAFTLAFPNLGKEGNIGGIVIGQPPKLISNDLEEDGREYKDSDTGFHLETFYIALLITRC